MHPALPGGSVSICTATALESLDRFRTGIAAALSRRRPVSLTIMGGGNVPGPADLSAIFAVLTEAAAAAALGARHISVVMDASIAPPGVAWKLLRDQLPGAPLYFRIDGDWMRPDRSDGVSRTAFWVQLARLRHESGVQLAPATRVMSPCPLLAPEPASCVLPVCGIQAPAGTAWLPLEINLLRFADAHGRLDWTGLETALANTVALGDRLHDAVFWSGIEQCRDARHNRRLGICVTGIGDLVRSRRQDPARFATLEDISQLLAAMKEILVVGSLTLSRTRNLLPAIRASEPGMQNPDLRFSEHWRSRWQKAVAGAALAHRNLFVLSPWALFPSEKFAAKAFADLVPVLAIGDTCMLRNPRSLADWTPEECRRFYQHMWAVLYENGGGKQIAKQV